MESIFWTAPASDRFSTRKPHRSAFKPWAESSPRKIHASCSTFPIENPSKRSELAFEKNSKTPCLSKVKMDGISIGRCRRSMNLSSFLLPGLKAERCDFLVENRSGASALQKANYWFHPCSSIKRNCKRTIELKILQNRSKYPSEAKGRQFTEAKVTQSLFSFDTCTFLAKYRYRLSKR